MKKGFGYFHLCPQRKEQLNDHRKDEPFVMKGYGQRGKILNGNTIREKSVSKYSGIFEFRDSEISQDTFLTNVVNTIER